ncbi:bifunctional DNA primase/polymerase [Streptomyces sp. NPDC001982]|uniref:bifunctional DNA primase/polymerase n=1 Tax=unclassified Streptomyces TaxID=2593676 RepID=UPI00331A6DEF
MPQQDPDGHLRAALDAASRGWRVFPLAPCGKTPAVRDWEAQATTDPVQINRWWRGRRCNVGLAAGPSGLVVIDLDTPKDADDVPPADWALPGVTDGRDVFAILCERRQQPFPSDTYTVRTRSGGTHLYFAVPGHVRLSNTVKKHGWKVDTRASGGYVVAAGSVVDGRPYEIVRDVPPAVLPDWLTQLFTAPPTPPVRLAMGSPVIGRRALGLVRTVLDAGEGERNNRLYWAALRAYERGGEGADSIAAALVDAAVTVGLPEREARATIASAARRMRGSR